MNIAEKIKVIADSFRKELGFTNIRVIEDQLAKNEIIFIENIGFISFHFRKDNQSTIYEIAISREHQRKKYGTLLFRKLLIKAIEKGKKFIKLKVPEDNENAFKFYESLNFKFIKIEEGKKRKLHVYQYDINLPLLFYCGNGGRSPYDGIAQEEKWRLGLCSRKSPLAETQNNTIQFIDNDWKNYDHQKHLQVVKKHKPLLATVLDWQDLGDFNLIFSYAKELLPYSGNVLIIPKIEDTFDDYQFTLNNLIDEDRKIWNSFWFAYSVPTGYGSAIYRSDIFKDRFIHLLGGSPSSQMRYYNNIPNVVSLDGNYSMKVASFGKSCWQGNDSGDKVIDGCYGSFRYSLKKQYKYWRNIIDFSDCPLFDFIVEK